MNTEKSSLALISHTLTKATQADITLAAMFKVNHCASCGGNVDLARSNENPKPVHKLRIDFISDHLESIEGLVCGECVGSGTPELDAMRYLMEQGKINSLFLPGLEILQKVPR